jgi:hypothetical protein
MADEMMVEAVLSLRIDDLVSVTKIFEGNPGDS